MRQLQTKDLFVVLRALKEAGVKDTLKKAYSLSSGNVDQEELGMEMVVDFVVGLANTKAEPYIYEFLGGVFEMKPEEVATMNPLDLLENINKLKEVISGDDWAHFFRSALHLLLKS